ncbi:MAG: GMC family oxidoreductase [Deltaproteobacteria bacterium]|nr:GMC family oxidoreductase [Deltaproteobacteria bacterium]
MTPKSEWKAGVVTRPATRLTTDVAVIGSGPGGSVAATVLAEAGFDVLVIEEGALIEAASLPLYSSAEMEAKYRNGGLTAAIGRPTVSYVEGRCVGGGSEVNGGLWFRTPSDVLDRWEHNHGVRLEGLDTHHDVIERELGGINACPPTPAGRKLHEGAAALGWPSFEARCTLVDSELGQRRRGMSTTYLPRALGAGARLLPRVRVIRLERSKSRWLIRSRSTADSTTPARAMTIEARNVVLAAGAIHTPAILWRSGLRRAGRSLGLHATLKVVARFADEVNPTEKGRSKPRIPGAMVDEFSPGTNLECAVSGRAHLALELVHHAGGLNWLSDLERVAGYAARIHNLYGAVHVVPGALDPVVTARWTKESLVELGTATKRLCRMLLAAGATELLPALDIDRPISRERDIDRLEDTLPTHARPMTIHLTSSCPMGRECEGAVTDSFGRVHGAPDLSIADASILPTAPRVNPQATVMALARRNASILAEELRTRR